MKICNKQKKFGFKFIIYSIFTIYILTLIYIVLLKNGDSLVFEFMRKQSLNEKLSHAQIIPFLTIKELIFEPISYSISIKNLLGNIIIFSPLGFLLPIVFSKLNSLRKIFPIVLLSSLIIELIQLFTGFGTFDIDDLILNTLGGIIGYYLYKLFSKKIIK